MGVIYMIEKMVRLSQLNLSGLLESSIKSVENDFKEKYLNENESLSDYGFNHCSLRFSGFQEGQQGREHRYHRPVWCRLLLFLHGSR